MPDDGDDSAKNIFTAITRRFSNVVSRRPSLTKTEPTAASTVFRPNDRCDAIPSLVSPSAMAASTSNSRALRFAATSPPTIARS